MSCLTIQVEFYTILSILLSSPMTNGEATSWYAKFKLQNSLD